LIREMQVLAIRHGPTSSKKEAGADLDRQLTEEGKALVRGAREHARFMGFENPAATFATIARRTQETARLFAPSVKPIVILGAYPDVVDGWSETMTAKLVANFTAACELAGGSSVSFKQQMRCAEARATLVFHQLLRLRLERALRELPDGSDVLLVGHGPTMMTALQQFTREGVPEDFVCGPCEGSLFRIRFSPAGMEVIGEPQTFWPERS